VSLPSLSDHRRWNPTHSPAFIKTTDATGDHTFGREAEKPLGQSKAYRSPDSEAKSLSPKGKVGVLVKAWWAPNIQWDVQWLIKTTSFPRIVHRQVGMAGQSVIPGRCRQLEWW